MFGIVNNTAYTRGSVSAGAQKGYDYYFNHFTHRFMLRSQGGGVSASNNLVYPYATGKYRTFRGLDFAGLISSYPDFPNGATTITDNALVQARNIGTALGTFTNMTLQTRYLLDKVSNEAIKVGDYFAMTLSVNLSGVSGYINMSGVIPTIRLRKVDSGGTITTIKTIVGATGSLADTGIYTWNIQDATAGGTLDTGDLLFIEIDFAIGSLYMGNGAYSGFNIQEAVTYISIENN